MVVVVVGVRLSGAAAGGVTVGTTPGMSVFAGAPVTDPGARAVNGGQCVPIGSTVSGGRTVPGGVVSNFVEVVVVFPLIVVVVVAVVTASCGLGALGLGMTSTYRWLEIPLGVAMWTSMTDLSHGSMAGFALPSALA